MPTKIGPVTLPASTGGEWAGLAVAVIGIIAIAKHVPYVKKFV